MNDCTLGPALFVARVVHFTSNCYRHGLRGCDANDFEARYLESGEWRC